MKFSILIAPTLALAFVFTSCTAPRCDLDPVESQFTLGNAQRQICEGMSQADVATALGSPNIVTKDSAGKETWVYDKIATDVKQSSRSAGVFLLVLNGCTENSSYSRSQQTLTIVIKFNESNQVDTVSYHASRF